MYFNVVLQTQKYNFYVKWSLFHILSYMGVHVCVRLEGEKLGPTARGGRKSGVQSWEGFCPLH